MQNKPGSNTSIGPMALICPVRRDQTRVNFHL